MYQGEKRSKAGNEGSHAELYFQMEKLLNHRSSQQHTATMQTPPSLDERGETWLLFEVYKPKKITDSDNQC